jgi:hypothetical protein
METNLIQDYKIFNGRYNEQMPLLVNESLEPLTAKDVMQYKLQAIQSKDKGELDFWIKHKWDTATGLVCYKEDLIIDPNSRLLLEINQDSELYDGSLILNEIQYLKLSKENEVIKRNKIIAGMSLTKREAKKHPIWLKLAQDDKSLLNEYVEVIFDKAKEIYNYNKNMGIYLPYYLGTPLMRGWCFRGLDDWFGANARGGLDGSGSCLLGKRAQNFGAVLEQIAKEAKITSPQEIKKALEFYKSGKSGNLDLKLLQ